MAFSGAVGMSVAQGMLVQGIAQGSGMPAFGSRLVGTRLTMSGHCLDRLSLI